MRILLATLALGLGGCAHLFIEPYDSGATKAAKVTGRVLAGVTTLGFSELYYGCGKYGCVPYDGGYGGAVYYNWDWYYAGEPAETTALPVPYFPPQTVCVGSEVEAGYGSTFTVICR